MSSDKSKLVMKKSLCNWLVGVFFLKLSFNAYLSYIPLYRTGEPCKQDKSFISEKKELHLKEFGKNSSSCVSVNF